MHFLLIQCLENKKENLGNIFCKIQKTCSNLSRNFFFNFATNTVIAIHWQTFQITTDNTCFFFLDIASLKLNEDDSVSEADRDTLGPLPPPSAPPPWGNQLPYSGSYIPPNAGFMPMPFNYTNDNNSSCKTLHVKGAFIVDQVQC